MIKVAFADDVVADHEEAEISFLVATSVRNIPPWDLLESRIRVMEQKLTDGTLTIRDKTDPFIESWHTAYRSFGLNPNRTRPSVEALGRRVARDGRLPRINPAVDAYNLISLHHGLPTGAFDLDAIEGDIIIRRAGPGEPFVGIGGNDDPAREGEIVYADASRLLTRGWNYRDCDHTKVTPTSRAVIFMVERVSKEVPHEVLECALDELAELIANHAHVAARANLNRHHPIVVFPRTAPGT